MTKIDETSTNNGQPPRRETRWKRLWEKTKTPLQLIIGQFIGYACGSGWDDTPARGESPSGLATTHTPAIKQQEGP